MPDNPYWAAAKAAYDTGNHEWLPCPETFYQDMLNVVPPVCFDHHPALGCHFGVGEVWRHTGTGQPIYLMFRSQPAPACRMATPSEFLSERLKTLPADWQRLNAVDVLAACERLYPGERAAWQSDGCKEYVEKKALETIHGNNLTVINGVWYAARVTPPA